MRQVVLKFEPDPSLEHIEVIIRAPAADEQVREIKNRLSDFVPKTLTVTDSYDNQRIIRISDIIKVSVNGKLLRIVTENGSYSMRQTMQNLEEKLDSQQFIRISRYEIVNLSNISRLDFTIAGTLRLELTDGTETWASRRCIPAIRKQLKTSL